MSHEDIQRTLQANMPLPPAAAATLSKSHNGHHLPHQQPHPAAANAHHPHPVDLNPMDFIEHDVVAPPTSATGAPPTATAAPASNFDMNLDAFDVFGDFSDLQENNGGHHYGQQQQQPHLNKIKRGDAEHHLAQITEYSPDWAWSDVSEPADRFDSSLRLLKSDGDRGALRSLDQGSVEKDSTFSISTILSSSSLHQSPAAASTSPSHDVILQFTISYTYCIHPQDRFPKVPFVSSLSPSPSPRYSLVSRIALYIAYSCNSILYTLKRSLRSLSLSLSLSFILFFPLTTLRCIHNVAVVELLLLETRLMRFASCKKYPPFSISLFSS